MRVSVGDIELYVHEKGEGRPLVALHGGPGLDGSVWFPGLDRVAAAGYRVLALDHRANGRSDAGDTVRWTVPQMADDVEAVIVGLALEDVVVMGWSFGSFVTQSHMVRHGTAAAYVLMGTIAEPGALTDVRERLASFEPEVLREQVVESWALEASVDSPEAARQLLADQMPFHCSDPTGPLVAELVAADRVVYRPEVLRHFAAGGEYGMRDLREQLRVVEVPTLVLSGADDRTTPAASAHELVSILPLCEEIVFAESAHMMLYEQPDAVTAALLDFLARH
ncbi:alpha/beta hydrolase [Gaiella sp.]|uniref:alpha/beta fold hydrolase n=1 Tax=Gaiella sp. TaxID=2663207 RepID=UPI003263AB8E